MPGLFVPGSEQPRLERDRSQMVSDRPGGGDPRSYPKAVELAPTTAELADHLEAYESGTAKVAYLKEHHSGYMARASASRCEFPFPTKAGVDEGVVVKKESGFSNTDFEIYGDVGYRGTQQGTSNRLLFSNRARFRRERATFIPSIWVLHFCLSSFVFAIKTNLV